MGLMDNLDKAKEFASEHSEQVDKGVEKGGDLLDEKTGDKYTGEVDKGQEFLRNQVGGTEGAPTPES